MAEVMEMNADDFRRSNGKRASEGADTSHPSKKLKTEMRQINISEKNPISVLNEIKFGLKYDIIQQSGPSHNPTFKVKVDVDGQTYYGVGNSKKAAKSDAAMQVLNSFIQFPIPGMIVTNNDTICLTKMDFTSDQMPIKPENAAAKANKNRNIQKGPLMTLNELYPNAEMTCTNNESDPFARFQVTVKIGGETFVGSGANKKFAKNAAAAMALRKLINYSAPEQSDPFCGTFDTVPNVKKEDFEKADAITKLVNDKFLEVMGNDLDHMKRKVLAGIVMIKDGDVNNAEVLSVTTGTKCVSGEHISINGASLNDMHAEILSRRCLMNYFYDQLELVASGGSAKSIFEKRPNGSGYKLKDGIEFHLYINTAPCGDARIFSPHEETGKVDKHPNRISRGQLRTKIESGEGTIPVKAASSIQTWDGIIQGERLLTMSCSDKICRWNVLGLQGSLLSHFIEPIYLKSLILGSLFKHDHLYRAICGRIENTIQGLPPPFKLSRPEMLPTTSKEVRHPHKAPNFAVIWMKGFPKPEIVNTMTGKIDDSIVSAVSKQKLGCRFAALCGKVDSITNIKTAPPVYNEAKTAVEGYEAAKERLIDSFKKAGLGNWVCKPIEQDMFEIA
ncbi:unnamed protein product [Acanthoscelides obtectus]|uniref:Double-stranded RNA-specific editase Adar n=2 Tax=Acanthoscelides obtectus TaxID=200917 RepID=A0A9P0L3Y3_ACAOB|nr:unnamed protein product [Acanthoscelides obtectus]CAK1659784.1 Double-stranded RNA-specific editase Adar [Acanthoscelides obtectus]